MYNRGHARGIMHHPLRFRALQVWAEVVELADTHV
jgi:hypothetical protein